jgi:hypothetical protein
MASSRCFVVTLEIPRSAPACLACQRFQHLTRTYVCLAQCFESLIEAGAKWMVTAVVLSPACKADQSLCQIRSLAARTSCTTCATCRRSKSSRWDLLECLRFVRVLSLFDRDHCSCALDSSLRFISQLRCTCSTRRNSLTLWPRTTSRSTGYPETKGECTLLT